MSEYLEIYRSNGIRNITTSKINQHGGNGPPPPQVRSRFLFLENLLKDFRPGSSLPYSPLSRIVGAKERE